jgi:hypothetical protein
MTVADLPLPAKSRMARSLACPAEAALDSIDRVLRIENFDRGLVGSSPEAMVIGQPGGDSRPRLLILNISLLWAIRYSRVKG